MNKFDAPPQIEKNTGIEKSPLDFLRKRLSLWLKMGILLPPLFLAQCKEITENKNKESDDSLLLKSKIEVVDEQATSKEQAEKTAYIVDVAAEIEREINKLPNGFHGEGGFVSIPSEVWNWNFWNHDKINGVGWNVSDNPYGQNKDRASIENIDNKYYVFEQQLNDTLWTYQFTKDGFFRRIKYVADEAVDTSSTDSAQTTNISELQKKITDFNKRFTTAVQIFHKYQHDNESERVKRETIPNLSLSRESVDSVIEKLRADIACYTEEEIVKDEKIPGKIISHDHEILSLKENPLFGSLSYNDFINKRGESLYYPVDPKISCDDYDKKRGGSEDYEEYLKDNAPHTQEFHIGSTAYAILRSGLYDMWKHDGGEKDALAERIINDITNPDHYVRDPNSMRDTITVRGLSDKTHRHEEDQMYDTEWLTATWIELEKRGMHPSFDRGGKGEPFTLEQLNAMNQKRLDYTLEYRKTHGGFIIVTEEDAAKKKETKEENHIDTAKTLVSPCSGAHALHALIMYDVKEKDSVKLKEHLAICINKLEEALKDASKYSPTSWGGTAAMHDFSHWLLPLTELTEKPDIDQHTEEVFRNSIKRMIQFAEAYTKEMNEEPDRGEPDSATLAHIVDILDHLPQWIRD